MIGKTISHYKILEKLGEGGMGEVYLAEDSELDRKVALKFLLLNLNSDRELRARFREEAKAAAALNHPNIITIHEIGEYEGKTYITMEYVDGETLRTHLKAGSLSSDEVIEITRQLCAGLEKAHAARIIHRDLKPENILIDTDGRVRIADFGLARLGGTTRLTRESSTLGTLHYMSPAHFLGFELDHRSDIWSVGVMLYEMLTGQLPFKGEYQAGVMYSVLNEEPEFSDQFPSIFHQVLLKALAKNPDDRYQNIVALSINQQLEYTYGEVNNLNNIGYILTKRHEYDKALDILTQCVQVAKEENHVSTLANALENIGDIQFNENDFAAASLHFRESFELFESLGMRPAFPEVLSKLALAEAKMGNYDEALQTLQQLQLNNENAAYSLEVS
jgi:serine/threonine protein kinase